jgi:hypothetical protein
MSTGPMITCSALGDLKIAGVVSHPGANAGATHNTLASSNLMRPCLRVSRECETRTWVGSVSLHSLMQRISPLSIDFSAIRCTLQPHPGCAKKSFLLQTSRFLCRPRGLTDSSSRLDAKHFPSTHLVAHELRPPALGSFCSHPCLVGSTVSSNKSAHARGLIMP